MSEIKNHVEYKYDELLDRARISLLNSTFEQLWIRNDSFVKSEQKSSNIPKNDTKFRRDTPKIFIILIGLSFTFLVLSIPFLIKLQYKAKYYRNQCSSLSCIAASHRIIENLDRNVDPCTNFYAYACGGWLNKHNILPSQTSVSYFKEIHKENLGILFKIFENKSDTNFKTNMKLKRHFFSCLNRTNDENIARKTLVNVLWKIARSPLIYPKWSTEHFNIINSLIATHRYKIDPLFRVRVTIDDRNSNSYIIHLQQSGLSFNEISRYNDERIYCLFKKFAINLLENLHLVEISDEILKQIDDLFLFEKHLSTLFEVKQSNNPYEFHHIRTYEQIRKWFSSWFDIDHYFERIFHKDRSFFLNRTFLISAPSYFQRLRMFILSTPKSILANYISFQVIQDLLPYMPDRFIETKKSLMNYIRGTTEEKQLWEICTKRTDEAFGYATSYLFVSKVFHGRTKEKIESMIEEIRLAFIETLPNIQWMDNDTRQQAYKKAKMIMNRLVQAKHFNEPASIDKFYEDLNLSTTDNPIINQMLIQKFQKEYNLRQLEQSPDIEEWSMSSVDVNAYYAPWKNMIVFPAGILQTPFFDAYIPIALNFGSIGSIIGHELIHAFDASGRYFDAHGNLNNWWRKGAFKNFDDRAKCFINRYALYHIGNAHINGLLTLDENIADNGGLQLAYSAYKHYLKRHRLATIKNIQYHRQELLPGLNLTDEQLFFLGFAQTWCTKTKLDIAKASLLTDTHTYPEYRVIGSLSNMPEFSKAFKCSNKSPMNPKNKCGLWLTSNRKI